MRCPFCTATETKVVDSREVVNTFEVRRRRECEVCHKRFTTYERIEQNPLAVIKKDGRREEFLPEKLNHSIAMACHKRPVSTETINKICVEIEAALRNEAKSEVPSSRVGEIVMERLRNTDKVAYIRFASIYREFADVKDFRQAIKEVTRRDDRGTGVNIKTESAAEDNSAEEKAEDMLAHSAAPEAVPEKTR